MYNGSCVHLQIIDLLEHHLFTTLLSLT